MAKRKSIWILFGILVIGFWMFGSAIQARAETLKCKSETKQVTQVNDNLHAQYYFGITASEGMATCENGETAAVKTFTTWYADMLKDVSTQAYIIFTFKDSSKIIMKANYTQIKDPKGEANWIWEGTGEIINASSRFIGIKGSSSFKGKQLFPDKRVVVDYTLTYSLPPK